MQNPSNRSYSNPPLKELNCITASQKVNTTLNSTLEASKILPFRPTKEIDNSFEMRIQKCGGLEGDRSTLIYRINKLQQEVDTLNKENSDLHSKLNQERARFEDFQKKMVHSSKVKNLVDKNYIGDLKYEREENTRLKHLLHSLEVERNDLRVRVKELEVTYNVRQHEKQEVIGKLQQKIDHVSIVEGDNRILVDKITLMHSKMHSFEKESHQIANVNEKMKNLLSYLELENRDILSKVDEECRKYGNYINAKNDELNNVKWAFKRQLKVISVHCMFSSIGKVLNLRMLIGLLKTKSFVEAKGKFCWTLKKLTSLQDIQKSRRLKEGFLAFKALTSWTGTSKISNNFIRNFSYKKFISKILNLWKRVTKDQITQKTIKNKSTKKLVKFLNHHIKNSVQTRLEHWKLLTEFSSSQRKVLKKLIKNFKSQSISLHFSYWKQRAMRLKTLQSIQDLSVDMAGQIVKIKFFLAFREYVKIKKSRTKVKTLQSAHKQQFDTLSILSEMKRFQYQEQSKRTKLKEILSHLLSKDLNLFFQRWKFEVLNLKSSSKYDHVLSHLSNKEKEKFVSTIFLAWKNIWTKGKLLNAEEALSIERPLRQQLQSSLSDLRADHQINLQKSALNMILNPLYKQVNTYFSHWKSVGSHYKGYLHNVRYLLIKYYKLFLIKGFKSWKEKVFTIKIDKLNYSNNRTLMEKIELDQQVRILSDLLQSKEINLQGIKQKKMSRCIAYMKNRDLANSLRIWSLKARTKTDKMHSARDLRKVYLKALSRVSFTAIKKVAESNKQKLLRGRKMQKYLIVRCKDSLSLTFIGWQSITKTMKNLRKLVSKNYAKRMMNNKVQAWKEWKEYLTNDKHGQLAYQNQKLASYSESLEKELGKFKELFCESQDSNKRLDQMLRVKGKQRVTIALIKGCTEKWKRYWIIWKSMIRKFEELKKKSRKIVNCWTNKELRQAWHSWLVFIKVKVQKNNSAALDKHKKDMASFKLENKKIKVLLEQEIEEKSTQIVILSKDLAKIQRFSEFLLSKSMKNMSANYSISLTSYFFTVMKDRYLGLKGILQGFSETVRALKLRRGLKDIKSFCLETIKINSLRNMLVSVFKRYGVRFLRNEFDRWIRNTWQINETKLKSVLKTQTGQLQALKKKESVIKMKNREKFLKLFIGQNKQNVFNGWKSAADGVKRRKMQTELLKRKILQLKFTLITSSLSQNAQNLKLARAKTLKAMNLSSFNLTKLIFNEWKVLHLKTSNFSKILNRVISKLNQISLIFSFNQVKSFASSERTQANILKLSKASQIKRILLHKFSKSSQYYLSLWRNMKNARTSNFKVLRSSILRAFHRSLRSAFDLWNEDMLLKETVEITNTQGIVAIENNILKGRIATLNKLIEDEGLDPKYVEKYILEKETKQSALTLQSIHLMKYKSGLINPKDRIIVPKYFLSWKQWVIKRKKILRVSYRLLCFTRKPELLSGFLNWKHGLSLIINSVNKLPRRGLYSLIAKMDLDIKTLESKLETTHKSVLFLETYSNLLSSQVRRGQNMALVSCSLQQQKSLFQGFSRWSYYTGLCRVQDLLEQLTSTEQNLYIVKSTLKNMEEDNMSLVEENYELRLASLDGVAIAEAFETLSKEREKLSLDLAERTATINKLIEQNNELADRLRSVGFDDTPEREVLKLKKFF